MDEPLDEEASMEDPKKLTFSNSAIRSGIRAHSGIGKIQGQAVELIERCSSTFMCRLVESTQDNLSVDRIKKSIAEDVLFSCLEGALDKVEPSGLSSSSLTAGIRRLQKNPTRKRPPSDNASRKVAKKALAEAKGMADDSCLPMQRLLPTSKIVLDEDDYD